MGNNQVQKTFTIGDKWLYYKIYCGVKTADTILLEIIKPLTEKLIEQKLIDKWFFIRYSDPEPHLRVRFQITDINNLGEIIINIKNLLKPFLDNKQVWDVQLGTYQRELKRYGTNTIDLAESTFYCDSKEILAIIENSGNDEKRFINIFKLVENLIFLFKFEDQKTISFLERMQIQFKEEFRVDSSVKKELSDSYRKLESLFLNDFEFLNKNNIEEIVERFLILDKENKLEVTLDSLLASFIHMSINRCFRSKQRLYEMMIYDFMFRKNKSKFMRYGKL